MREMTVALSELQVPAARTSLLHSTDWALSSATPLRSAVGLAGGRSSSRAHALFASRDLHDSFAGSSPKLQARHGAVTRQTSDEVSPAVRRWP